MDREEVNRSVLALLGRFSSVDTQLLLAEAQTVDEAALLESGVLVNDSGRVQIHLIGVMEALLTLALGQKPDLTVPEDISFIRDALILFLKLNHTESYAYRPNDTPSSWAFRLLDKLFTAFSESDTLTIRDQLVLRRIGENKLWEQSFGIALDLYIRAVESGSHLLVKADQPAVVSTGQTFKRSVKERYDKIPKTKYGAANVNFRDITEYAIGQYLDGLDVNEALSQTLVQAQLGTQDDQGKARFNAFMKANRITQETFPTTVHELHQLVSRSIPFQETEAEIANALYTFAKENGQSKEMNSIFYNFTESVLPLAAKCAKLFTFAGLEKADRTSLIARWMRQTDALRHVREMPLREQVVAMLSQVTKDDLRNLNAFRGGRTKQEGVPDAELDAYVKSRIKLLTLNAMNQKMKRVEDALSDQIGKTERFTAKPGKGGPRDITFGIQEFFRSMRSVFEDIFDIADASRRKQLQNLNEFNKTYGPLPLVNLLAPRGRGTPIVDWTGSARARLNEVPYYVFESE